MGKTNLDILEVDSLEVGNVDTITVLTDSSGGTAVNTIPAQGATYVQATQQETIASLAGKINEILAALQSP